jgi:hypothetical protein
MADLNETIYRDSAHTSGYYFARFKNSANSTFSPYSDPAPVNGYGIYSARSIIDKALGEINKKTSDVMSDEYAFGQIDNCQMECLREFKRWSFMQTFNAIIGETSEGTWKVALPTDCDDQNTTKSIYNFRIGKEEDMIWVDKEEWNAILSATAFTTLATNLSIGDAAVVLTDSSDFDDAGTIQMGANQIAYSANNKTTNTLTLSAVSTVNVTAGQDVFQNTSLGCPSYYTTFGGYLYHWPITSATYDKRNYYLDYYKSLTQIQHDSDNIVLLDPVVVEYYLCWKFLLRLNNGTENTATNSYKKLYEDRRDTMKKKESLNRNFILNPNTGYY